MHRPDDEEMDIDDTVDMLDPVDEILHQILQLQSSFSSEMAGLKAIIDRQNTTITTLNATVTTLSHKQANLQNLLKEVLKRPPPVATRPPTRSTLPTAPSTRPTLPTAPPTPYDNTAASHGTKTAPKAQSTWTTVVKSSQTSKIGMSATGNRTQTPHTRQISPYSDAQRKFTILRPQDSPTLTAEQLVNVRDILNTTVRPLLPETFPQNPVLGVTQTPKGHLSIMTCPSVSAAALLTHKKVMIRELDTHQLFCDGIQDNSPWHKVIIHRVRVSDFEDSPEGMEAFRAEITNYNDWVELADVSPRYLKGKEQRHRDDSNSINPKEREHASMVVVVKDETTLKKVVKYGVWIRSEHLRAVKFLSARPHDICKRCLGYGHHQDVCKRQPRCAVCTQTHSTMDHACQDCDFTGPKACKCTPPKCIHCEGQHLATDQRNCNFYRSLRNPNAISPPNNNTITIPQPQSSIPEATMRC